MKDRYFHRRETNDKQVYVHVNFFQVSQRYSPELNVRNVLMRLLKLEEIQRVTNAVFAEERETS